MASIIKNHAAANGILSSRESQHERHKAKDDMIQYIHTYIDEQNKLHGHKGFNISNLNNINYRAKLFLTDNEWLQSRGSHYISF